MPAPVWRTEDFEAMSWHDVHVYGLSVIPGPHGSGELILDLDFILEWICNGGVYQFRLAPATLTFHEVTDLTVSLDYASVSAAMGPFSLAGIEREQHVYPSGYTASRWNLSVNWPSGRISFVAAGFTQILRREPTLAEQQSLEGQQRPPIESRA